MGSKFTLCPELSWWWEGGGSEVERADWCGEWEQIWKYWNPPLWAHLHTWVPGTQSGRAGQTEQRKITHLEKKQNGGSNCLRRRRKGTRLARREKSMGWSNIVTLRSLSIKRLIFDVTVLLGYLLNLVEEPGLVEKCGQWPAFMPINKDSLTKSCYWLL